MKIRIKDFCYKGEHYDGYEAELPQLKNIDDIPWDRFMEMVNADLASMGFVEEKES